MSTDTAISPAPGPQPITPRQAKKKTFKRVMRRVRHGVRAFVTRPLMWLVVLILPRLYNLYMWLVWKTSRVRVEGGEEFRQLCRDQDGLVAILWHEEVLTVAWGYRDLHGHTLASLGDAGRVITRMLELNNFTVFRGGSSTRGSRKHTGVLKDLIDHMKSTPQVMYGITVDGSAGPPYRMKKGAAVIARECGRPLALARTWYKRSLRFPTWDRMALPLPFNVIHQYFIGPYWVPEEAQSEEQLLAFCEEMENRLIDLAARSYLDLGQAVPGNLVKRNGTPPDPTNGTVQA